jgi:purine-nucleoside phosphorylase
VKRIRRDDEPTYETPAEIRYLRAIGVDAVGIYGARRRCRGHMGMKVAGLSMLVNLAADLSPKPISHSEVVETAAKMNADLCDPSALLRYL